MRSQTTHRVFGIEFRGLSKAKTFEAKKNRVFWFGEQLRIHSIGIICFDVDGDCLLI